MKSNELHYQEDVAFDMKKKYFNAYKKLILIVILLGLFTFTPVCSNLQEENRINDHIEALKDSSYLVRRNAALALGKIGSEKAVDALIKALNHKDPQFQYFIYTTLKGIYHPKAAAAAKEYLSKIKKKEK